MFFDPFYMICVGLPALVLSLAASAYTKSTFNKYSRVASSRGYTGAQAAEAMLRAFGVYDVTIEPTRGFLSDHYDPRTKSLRLSEQVYGSRSLSAIGVACHEAGHALQHAKSYSFLGLRTALVPAAGLGSNLSYPLIVLGFFIKSPFFAYAGVTLLAVAVLITIVTLPVEWDASKRAKKVMVEAGLVSGQEARAAGSVLNAAFMTYLASAATAILTLLYWLVRLGILGGRDD